MYYKKIIIICVFCSLIFPFTTISKGNSDIVPVFHFLLSNFSCNYKDSTIKNGSSITRTHYETSIVAYGESCVEETQTGTCNKGTLSWTGTYEYGNCTVDAPVNCTYDGQNIAHDETTTRTRYETSIVAYGESCVEETQTGTCNNGTLSWTGTYEYGNCAVDAPVDCTYDGQNIAHDETTTRTRYETDLAAYGESCVEENQKGTCSNGVLNWTGTYEYDSCTVENSCSNDSCQNGGTCNIESGLCDCITGYIGTVCEELACTQEKCKNGGICNMEDGSCSCSLGWIGDTCNVEACPVDKCLNGGTCNEETGECHCVDVWTGPTCQDLHCPDDSCNNRGTCNEYTGECTCEEGWNGDDCENESCPLNKCGLNGQCQDADGSCVCDDGYTGSNCQVDLCETEFDNCNEHGTCSYAGTTGSCSCEADWSGDSCETYTCANDSDCLNGGTCDTGTCVCVDP